MERWDEIGKPATSIFRITTESLKSSLSEYKKGLNNISDRHNKFAKPSHIADKKYKEEDTKIQRNIN